MAQLLLSYYVCLDTEKGIDDKPPTRGAKVTPCSRGFAFLELEWHFLYAGGGRENFKEGSATD